MSFSFVNRCWSSLTSPLRRLPDFIIIGAQKSGTSALYLNLLQHPKILPATRKEARFFDLSYSLGERAYRTFFPLKVNLPEAITGEGSPDYMLHPLVPERVHRMVPSVKLIVLLRNPVDRAYSHFQHTLRRGHETLSFTEAIDQESTRITGEEARMIADPHYVSLPYYRHSYLARGQYSELLKRWLRFFPRDQFYFLKSENFYKDMNGGLNATCNFLGLRPHDFAPVKKKRIGLYEPMDVNIRHRLEKYFRGPNEKLQELIGMNFHWPDGELRSDG